MDMHVEPLATNGPAGRGGSRPNRLGGQVYLVTHKRPPRIGGLFIFPAQCGAGRMRIRFARLAPKEDCHD